MTSQFTPPHTHADDPPFLSQSGWHTPGLYVRWSPFEEAPEHHLRDRPVRWYGFAFQMSGTLYFSLVSRSRLLSIQPGTGADVSDQCREIMRLADAGHPYDVYSDQHRALDLHVLAGDDVEPITLELPQEVPHGVRWVEKVYISGYELPPEPQEYTLRVVTP